MTYNRKGTTTSSAAAMIMNVVPDLKLWSRVIGNIYGQIVLATRVERDSAEAIMLNREPESQ